MKKSYEDAKKLAQDAFRTASEQVGKDLSEINQKIVKPTVELGRNRVVSTVAGAKTGFLIGALVGPVGMAKGALIGAVAGAVGGPRAMEKLGEVLGHKKDSPANDVGADKEAPKTGKPNDPAP